MIQVKLGVDDIAYSDGDKTATTGDVAGWLEDKYHVMDLFAIEHIDEIGAWLAEGLSDRLKDVLAGAPMSDNAFLDGEQKIRAGFQRFIETEEIARINPQTPTRAALEGRSRRRKNRKGPRRVSFFDTGEYMAAFRAWIVDPDDWSGVWGE